MTLSSWSLIATTALSIVAAPMSKQTDRADGEVRSMHLAATNGQAEFVVKVTGKFKVKDFKLTNPDRVVLDITGAVLAPGLKTKTVYDGVNRAGVTGVRANQTNDTSVRLVLVMDQAKPYKVTTDKDGVRVSFAADRAFAAWSTGSAPAPAAQPEPAENPVREPKKSAAQEDTTSEEQPEKVIDIKPPANRPKAPRRLTTQKDATILTSNFSQEPTFTMNWENANIQDVIAGFQEISGRSIILGKNVKDIKVTAMFINVPWPEAFVALLGAYGLSVQEVEGRILRVDDPAVLATYDSLEAMSTDAVRINYASAGTLVKTVESMLSKRGSVVADSGSNSLIITETRTRLPDVVRFIQGLDVSPRQVSIQAEMVFVDRTDVEQLGFKYDLGTGGQFYNKLIQRVGPDGEVFEPNVNVVDLGGNAISAIANADAIISSAALDVTYSIAIGNFTLSSFLQALGRVELTDVQTEPAVITKDNKTASITVGEEIPVRVIDASSIGLPGQAPKATVQFKKVGVKLEVTPHITNNRKINLEIKTERSALKPLAAADLGFIIDLQETKNEMIVGDGEVQTVGSYTLTSITRSKTGIPLLSGLPVLGSLFSFTSTTENQKDLIILITARILDDFEEGEEEASR